MRARSIELVLQAQHLLDPARLSPSSVVSRWMSRSRSSRSRSRDECRPACVRSHEALRLVQPQRLRVHPDELGGDGDHVARAVHQPDLDEALTRVLARHLLVALERASFSAFVSFFGIDTFTRASRSPRPLPLSCGAPRPLTRSSFPLSVPPGIFSDTGPSGVGISTDAPSAASANVTGTSSTRSAPRRS